MGPGPRACGGGRRRLRICGPRAPACPAGAQTVARLLEGSPPPVGTSVVSDVIALGARGTVVAVVHPFRLQGGFDEEVPDLDDDTWCAEAGLEGIVQRDRAPATVALSRLAPPTSPTTACDWGLADVPMGLRGTDLELPLGGYADFVLPQIVQAVAAHAAPGQGGSGGGSPADVSTTTGEQIATALGVGRAVRAAVRHDRGLITGAWIDAAPT